MTPSTKSIDAPARSAGRAARAAGRFLGIAMMLTGGLHLAFGIAIAGGPLRVLRNEGFFGAAPADLATESWFWFMIAGFPLVLAGHLIDQLHRVTGRVPRALLPFLLLMGATALLYPASGLWLFFATEARRSVKLLERGLTRRSRCNTS